MLSTLPTKTWKSVLFSLLLLLTCTLHLKVHQVPTLLALDNQPHPQK